MEAALALARAGEAADPVRRSPTVLRPFLRFRRSTPAARRAARRAIEDDEGFRALLVEAVGADQVGEPAWRWLARPVGWANDWAAATDSEAEAMAAEAEASQVQRLERELEVARAAGRRDAERTAVATADAARMATALDDERRARRLAELDAATARTEGRQLGEERAGAIRSLKALERAHVDARHEVRRAEAARLRAEAALDRMVAGAPPIGAALAAIDAAPADSAGDGATGGAAPAPGLAGAARTGRRPAGDRPVGTPVEDRSEPPVEPQRDPDRALVAEGVVRAATAAQALADALAEVSAIVAPPPGDGPAGGGARRPLEPDGPVTTPPTSTADHGPPHAPARPALGRGSARDRRRAVRLPPPLLDDSPAAADHLLRLPGVAVLIDGYNVTMSAWPELAVAEQRRRLLAALDEIEARTGAGLTVVFDGVAEGGPPPASTARPVRVRFTDAGVEADDVVIAMVGEVASGRPVVVVSSDARVREGARQGGANLVGSLQFLAAIGRA